MEINNLIQINNMYLLINIHFPMFSRESSLHFFKKNQADLDTYNEN